MSTIFADGRNVCPHQPDWGKKKKSFSERESNWQKHWLRHEAASTPAEIVGNRRRLLRSQRIAETVRNGILSAVGPRKTFHS